MFTRRKQSRIRPRRLFAERLESRQCCAGDWQNQENRLDVNENGKIEPIDALLVINDLIRFGYRELETKPAEYTGPLRDVNGDGFIKPIDALLVINSLIATDEGDVAPQVKLPNQAGDEIDLRSFLGEKAVVLYFYPKDDTPGCTVEALDFSDRKDEIESLGAKIFGVSLDSVGSHDEFADKHKLNFDILADEARTATIAYGALTETPSGDPIARRITFIIGKDGIIKKVFSDVQVSTHGGEVVEALRAGIGG